MYLVVQPNPQLSELVYAPPASLATELAMMIAALASGTSVIYHHTHGAMIQMLQDACQWLGATVVVHADHLAVTGVAGNIHFQRKSLHCHTSATAFCVLTALASFSPMPVVLNADAGLRQYALHPFFQALRQLGIAIETFEPTNNTAIIHWGGGLDKDVCDIPGDISEAALVALVLMATLAPMPILLRIHGELVAASALLQTIHLLMKAGVTVESDEGLSLVRIYPGICQAGQYQLYGDYTSATPLLSLFALHSGSYEIAHISSDVFAKNENILALYKRIGLHFQQEDKTGSLWIHSPACFLAGQHHFRATDYAEMILLLVTLSAFIRGHVRIMDVAKLDERQHTLLEDLVTAFNQLGVRMSLTRRDSYIDIIDIIGAASYQGGLVFDNISHPAVLRALILASTKCRQANYFVCDSLLNDTFSSVIMAMQAVGVHCAWVQDALQVQPYWMAAS